MRPTRARSLVLLLPLLALTAALTCRFAWNEDAWWYLSTGDVLIAERGIPREDAILYPGVQGWMTSSWLWTVILSVIHRAGGPDLVVLFACTIACLSTALLFLPAIDRYGSINAAITFLYVWTASNRLSIKAELGTWLLAIVFLRVLERREPLTWRTWLLLGALEALWSNLHAGFLLGVVLLSVYACGELVEKILYRRSTARGASRRALNLPLWVALLAAAGASLAPAPRAVIAEMMTWVSTLNATPPAAAVAVPQVAADTGIRIAEMQPTFSDSRALSYQIQYLVFLGVGLLSFAGSRWPWRLPRVGAFILVAALGLSAVRFVHGFALVTGFLALRNLEECASWLRWRGQRPAGRWTLVPGVLAAVAAAAIVSVSSSFLWLNGFLESGQSTGHAITINPQTSCPEVAEYIRLHDVPGPIFNDEVLGGYLGHALYPQRKLFTDPRHLDAARTCDYRNVFAGLNSWEELQGRHGFRAAIFSNLNESSIRNRVREVLVDHPSWRVAFLDEHAVLLVLQEAGTHGPPAVKALPDETPFLVQARSPWQQWAVRIDGLFRGQSWAMADFYVDAMLSLKEWQACTDTCDALLEQRPHNAAILQRRAISRLNLGRPRAALADSEKVLRTRACNPQTVFVHAQILARLGRREEALDHLSRLLRFCPRYLPAELLRDKLLRGSPDEDSIR